MRTWLLILLVAADLCAAPTLRMELRGGIRRANVLHAATLDPVGDENPAAPGETLLAFASGLSGEFSLLINGERVPATVGGQPDSLEFVLPGNAQGGFVELAVADETGLSETATFPAGAAAGSPLLIAAEVGALVEAAAMAVGDARMAIAVTDRMGRPLGLYRKPAATDESAETALALARTGAFFSLEQAPLSSRTVRTLSMEHFPNGIPNQPAAALFGIENTNRGCDLNVRFEPGRDVPPARNAAGTGPGQGIATLPGGVAIYKNGAQVGGIGIAGIPPAIAEFAVSQAVTGAGFSLLPTPFPPPFAVYVDGIRLPFIAPEPATAAGEPGGAYVIAPRDGGPAPDGYLVEPHSSASLTADEVRSIIERAVARANRTRAAIRLPLGSRTRMVIAVTDRDGNVLGIFRMPDSAIFSIDVAVTKARNVVYFSSIEADPADLPGIPRGAAVTNRTIGFGAQSFFPSGIDASSPGPFRNLFEFDRANPCTQGRQPRHANQSGIVFFPGSAPLYKSGVLAGGLGVSGDGVEQDDYVTAAGAQGFEPPASIRADQFFIRGVRLPYWKFPRNPEQ